MLVRRAECGPGRAEGVHGVHGRLFKRDSPVVPEPFPPHPRGRRQSQACQAFHRERASREQDRRPGRAGDRADGDDPEAAGHPVAARRISSIAGTCPVARRPGDENARSGGFAEGHARRGLRVLPMLQACRQGHGGRTEENGHGHIGSGGENAGDQNGRAQNVHHARHRAGVRRHDPFGAGTVFTGALQGQLLRTNGPAAGETAVRDQCEFLAHQQERLGAAQEGPLPVFDTCGKESPVAGKHVLAFGGPGKEAIVRKMRLHEKNAFDPAVNGIESEGF